MGISREVWVLRDGRDGTPPNKGKKHLQTGENLSKQGKNTSKQPNRGKPFQATKQGKHLSSKGYFPIKCKSLQVVGVSGQGKAVASDGG